MGICGSVGTAQTPQIPAPPSKSIFFSGFQNESRETSAMRKLFRNSASEEELKIYQEELRGTRPFFLIFTFVLIAMYVFAFYSDPALLKPTRLIPLIFLGIVHGALYWFSPRLTFNRRWMVPFFLMQGLIVFTINLITHNQGMLIGLYLALSGAAVGIIEDLRKGIIPVAAYAVLASANQVLAWGWGSLFTWLILFGPMMFFVVVYVVMFTRETQSRRRSQELLKELEVAHQQLAEYATKVEELTLSAERQRMARELHDTLAQGLAGLILQLEAVDSHLGQDHFEQAQSIVHQAMGRARVTLADARRVIRDLRDETPSVESLSDAVRQEVERFTTATGIPCELELSAPNRIPPSVDEHARRAVAEGLTNIARHAEASNVWLKLWESEGMLEITLRDDGMGFDPTASVEAGGHYGLVGLRERVRLAGGSLKVISEAGAGTTLALVLPLEDGVADP
jgi:NarL family two-component system sensor histidine kinase YdfH